LADEVVRLRNTLGFYRWWLWQVGQALRSAPAPYVPGSTYARWWHHRRAEALRGVEVPPPRPCTLCGGAHVVLYLVPPSRRKRPEDRAARLCQSCYLAFYGGDAHWPLPEEEWVR
jgi:hypothetical protein